MPENSECQCYTGRYTQRAATTVHPYTAHIPSCSALSSFCSDTDFFKVRMRQAGKLGLFTGLLDLDKRLRQQQNTKKLSGTKSNCPHAQLRQRMINKLQKSQNPTATSVRSTSSVLFLNPAHSTTKWAGRVPKPRLQPDPLIHPHPHPPYGASSHCPLREPASTCYLFWFPAAAARVPTKPCLNFSSGFLPISID